MSSAQDQSSPATAVDKNDSTRTRHCQTSADETSTVDIVIDSQKSSNSLVSRSKRTSAKVEASTVMEHENQFSGPLSSMDTVIDLDDAYKLLQHTSLIIQMENRDIIQDKIQEEGSEDISAGAFVDAIITGARAVPGGDHYASFTKPYTFWVDSAILVFMGAFIGVVNLGYKYAITKAPMAYLTADNPGYPSENVGFAQGQLWWIGIGAGCGLVNGLVKLVLRLEKHVGFMAAIQMQQSDPLEAVKVVICAIISLVGGSSIGPEAGLAAIGGGISSFLYTRVLRFDENVHTRYKYYVLAGMAAGFTGFLPSPILAVMLTWELGVSPALWGLNQVHFLTLLAMSAVPAAAVFFAIEDTTLYDPLLVAIPNAQEYYPSKYAFAVGILFGFMGVGLAIAYHATWNFVRMLFFFPKRILKKYIGKKAAAVLINVIGGVLYGTLGYLFPLTMGDGSFQLQGIIASGPEIGSSVLAVSCFANMLTFWISMETGFVGGIFTPLLTTGNLMGGVFANLTGVDPVVAISCSFIALAAAVIPAPLLLVFFSSSLFNLGAKGIIPLTTCCFTSHLLIDGTGLLPILSNNWVKLVTASRKNK